MDFAFSTVVDDVFVEFTLLGVAMLFLFSILKGKRFLPREVMCFEYFSRLCLWIFVDLDTFGKNAYRWSTKNKFGTHANWSFFCFLRCFIWNMLFCICISGKDFWGNFCSCYTYATVFLSFALQNDWFHALVSFCNLYNQTLLVSTTLYSVCALIMILFKLAESFWTALVKRDELWRRESYKNDINTPVRLVIIGAKVVILSELCIFSGGLIDNLSKCKVTTGYGCPNLCSSVFTASLYIDLQ